MINGDRVTGPEDCNKGANAEGAKKKQYFGIHSRGRDVKSGDAAGAGCDNRLTETDPCSFECVVPEVVHPEVKCKWGEWSTWGVCGMPTGNDFSSITEYKGPVERGLQYRSRKLSVFPANVIANSPGTLCEDGNRGAANEVRECSSVVSKTMVPNSDSVSLCGAHLVATFSEAVKLATQDTQWATLKVVKSNSDGAKDIAVLLSGTDADEKSRGKATLSGKQLMVGMDDCLACDTQYTMLIPEGVLQGTSGTKFPGFKSGDWTFSTKASYSRKLQDWGTCSQTCDTGHQERKFVCKDCSGNVVDNLLCETAGKINWKEGMDRNSRECNTQACDFSSGSYWMWGFLALLGCGGFGVWVHFCLKPEKRCAYEVDNSGKAKTSQRNKVAAYARDEAASRAGAAQEGAPLLSAADRAGLPANRPPQV